MTQSLHWAAGRLRTALGTAPWPSGKGSPLLAPGSPLLAQVPAVTQLGTSCTSRATRAMLGGDQKGRASPVGGTARSGAWC